MTNRLNNVPRETIHVKRIFVGYFTFILNNAFLFAHLYTRTLYRGENNNLKQ